MILLVALCCGCVHLSYDRTRIATPLDEAVLRELLPGTATMTEVLARLGAPTRVWASENGDVVCAFAWLDEDSWRVSVSYTVQDRASASLAWNDAHAELPAVVAQFDDELVLQSIRRGLLREFAPAAR